VICGDDLQFLRLGPGRGFGREHRKTEKKDTRRDLVKKPPREKELTGTKNNNYILAMENQNIELHRVTATTIIHKELKGF